ncbi:MAG: hypothetical protein Q6366_011335 [Candidatus Freyarchaeota archaeon]
MPYARHRTRLSCLSIPNVRYGFPNLTPSSRFLYLDYRKAA